MNGSLPSILRKKYDLKFPIKTNVDKIYFKINEIRMLLKKKIYSIGSHGPTCCDTKNINWPFLFKKIVKTIIKVSITFSNAFRSYTLQNETCSLLQKSGKCILYIMDNKELQKLHTTKLL